MMPILFKIPILGKEVPAFGVMMTIGFLLAIYWAVRRAQRSGANPDVILNIGFISLIAGVLGCRIMFVVHYWDESFANIQPLSARLWSVMDLTRGGMEYYGGFLLSVICVVTYLHFWKHSLRWYFDIVAPSAAVGMALGRVGCFLNGCCFGSPCELPWAVRFPYGSTPAQAQWQERVPGAELPQELIYLTPTSRSPLAVRIQDMQASDAELNAALTQDRAMRDEIRAKQTQLEAATGETRARIQADSQALSAKRDALPFQEIRMLLSRTGMDLARFRELAHEHPSVPTHPAQLYSTVGLLSLALLLDALYWRRSRDGQVILTLMLIEPVSRILLELVRADNPVDTFGLTISQFIAIGLTLLGFVGLLWLRRLPPRSPAAVVWIPPEEEAAPPRKPKRAMAAG